MKYIYLDASARLKHDRQELGSEVVNATLEQVISRQPRQLVISSLSITETLSIFNRRRNEVGIPTRACRSALRGVLEKLRTFSHALLIDDQLLLSSTRYAVAHHIRSADAIHLTILLTLQATAARVVMPRSGWAAHSRPSCRRAHSDQSRSGRGTIL